MQKANGVNYSMTSKVQSRRKSVIERLEKQLQSGTKVMSNKEHKLLGGSNNIIPLSESDIKRINLEIKTLKARV